MRSMLDPEFDDMDGVNVLQDFDAYAYEPDVPEDEADRDCVRLECNGELLDAASVNPVEVRNSACGFKTLQFIYPRCNETHESLRFR